MTKFPKQLCEKFEIFKNQIFEPSKEHYKELAHLGQSPEVMIISCCDSRVDPEAIFCSGPGELFVVRNVANLVPPFETQGAYHGVSAAIEFAVLNIKVKYLLVIGHSGCGGIKAALDDSNTIQTDANFITKWMSILDEPKAKIMAKHDCHDKCAHHLELAGVQHSIENLRTFPCVKALEDEKKLQIFGLHFDIEKGELSLLDEASGEFILL